MRTIKPLLAAALLLAALSSHANEAACGVLLCMSDASSTSAPHQCKPYVEAYFDIRVYKKGTFKTKFDPVRTAKKRYETILAHCQDARQSDRDRIHAKFGMLQWSPFVFN
jgi:hypothetical protein